MTKSGFSLFIVLIILLIWNVERIWSTWISLTSKIFVFFWILSDLISRFIIFVCNEKNTHNPNIISKNQTIIRGLTLYHIEIICSIHNKIVNKTHKTKSRDQIVHTISINLLFHKVKTEKTEMVAIMRAIQTIIHLFTLPPNIAVNLHIT